MNSPQVQSRKDATVFVHREMKKETDKHWEQNHEILNQLIVSIEAFAK